MTDQRKLVLEWLRGEQDSSALRQVQALARDASTQVGASSPVVQTAGDAFATWSVRLLNAAVKGKRFTGLPALVRALGSLNATDQVAHISLRNGLKTGLVFCAPMNGTLLGAVISVRTEADVRRSTENFHFAQGERSANGSITASTRKKPIMVAELADAVASSRA